jgi:hypothetical protein
VLRPVEPRPLRLLPRSHPGGEGLDPIDDRLEAEGTEQVEGVLRPWQLRVDHRVGRTAPQPRDEASGVLHDHYRVPVAMRHKERRRIRSDVRLG